MAGVLTYVSIFFLMAIWVLGWCGVSVVVGALFDLPISTTALLGALLGPIGALMVILLGIIEKSTLSPHVRDDGPFDQLDDVFA